jgi:hypothetical protein
MLSTLGGERCGHIGGRHLCFPVGLPTCYVGWQVLERVGLQQRLVELPPLKDAHL